MAERPKRRKYKDNPYTLSYCEKENKYIITFKDGRGIKHEVEVSQKVYTAFDKFELDDLSELNEYDRHIEHSEIYENNINSRSMDKPLSLEDEIIRKTTFDELKKAIEMLPETQKRRIKKYYFNDENEYQIAREENTTQQAINKSLNQARIKLKEILKK